MDAFLFLDGYVGLMGPLKTVLVTWIIDMRGPLHTKRAFTILRLMPGKHNLVGLIVS